MKRRTFIKSSVLISTMSLETFANQKTNSSAQLLSDFLNAFNTKSQHFLFAETSLKKSLKKSIEASWKGYEPNQSKFYLINQKVLCPIVLKNADSEILDCAILCFESIDNQWIILQSLTSLHLEVILNLSKDFRKEELADLFLPKFSEKTSTFEYETKLARLYCKGIQKENKFYIEMMLTKTDGNSMKKVIQSNIYC